MLKKLEVNKVSIIHSIDSSTAQLPENYQHAKQAIAKCYNLDEVKTWSDKAKALATYARQSDDTELEDMAKRIRGRAIRRCGILMKEFDGRPDNAKKQSNGGGTLFTKSDAAGQAGLSKRRQNQATRLANIPEGQFEEIIELDRVPTMAELEELGTKKVVIKAHPKESLKGFHDAMYLAEDIIDLRERIKKAPDPDVLILAMFDTHKEDIVKLWPHIVKYMNSLIIKL